MEFNCIPKINADKKFGYIKSVDAFYRFVDDFNIVGVVWSQPTNISASYFLRLLQNGSSEKARGYGRGYNKENDEASNQFSDFYTSLLDHGALWKLKNGNVICTAMPYGDMAYIEDNFYKMKDRFEYPESLKLQFLDNKYRFRPNGDCMIVIYYDSLEETFDSECSEDELRRKAIQYSKPGTIRQQETSSYVRNQYVKEYAKRRAKGICQLCNKIAPFNDKEGKPFLETHHVNWLANGGADSIENTVALCPNCHRKMHILNLEEDIEKLLIIASRD